MHYQIRLETCGYLSFQYPPPIWVRRREAYLSFLERTIGSSSSLATVVPSKTGVVLVPCKKVQILLVVQLTAGRLPLAAATPIAA